MRSTQSFDVSFIRRLCKSNKKKANVFARISVDGSLPKEVTPREQINADSWDEKAEGPFFSANRV